MCYRLLGLQFVLTREVDNFFIINSLLPLTISCNRQLITHNPQPTTHNPQPTTHNPQLTTHNPQLITHNPQLCQ